MGHRTAVALLCIVTCFCAISQWHYVVSANVVSATGGQPNHRQNQALSLYVPLVRNGAGVPIDGARFDIVYAKEHEVWLTDRAGTYDLLLSTDVEYGIEELDVLQVSPDGSHIAVREQRGWAVYRRTGERVADQIGDGFALRWDSAQSTATSPVVLLSQIGHGIDRYFVNEGRSTPLLLTSDDTNDHSLTWDHDHMRLAFAHQEFGTQLYITKIDPFNSADVPYIGENLAAAKESAPLAVIEAVDSWHDQPISFYWSTDSSKLVFGAKQTIYVVDMTTEDAVTITPPGFGEHFTNRTVDLFNDQILYVGSDGIYRMDLSGQNAQRIVAGTDLHFAKWGASGAQVFYRGVGNELFVANADGTNNVVIPKSKGVQQLAPLP